MRILGLVGATHDSGLAILQDGVPELVLEEERFNRKKRTKRFPKRALKAALGEFVEGLGRIDVITTPWDVSRLRRTFLRAVLGRLPWSLSLVLQASHSPQDNDIVLLNSFLARKLEKHLGAVKLPPIVNVGHHDAHAASFFVSPFEEAAVLVMDGYGDDASTSAYIGRGNRLERLWQTGIFNSLGVVYTFVTKHLGFGFSDEGKVMALAAYGEDTYVAAFRDLVRPTPEGRYQVNFDYFSFDAFGELRPFTRRFLEVFGPSRQPGEELRDRHRDIARALQTVTEEIVLHMARGLRRTSGARQLCISGGVGLNCVANARVLAEAGFDRVWVPPCASDTGAPLGSALWHHHQSLGQPRRFELTHPFYGRPYSDREIEAALAEGGLAGERLAEAELIERVAQDLAAGKIVGWFQGRSEMGPRALGNRSILADPRRAEMKDIINARVKHRESFRPFAPAVLLERAAELFHLDQPDPFMTLAPRVRADKAHLIPAAVHVDGTGRIQTVERSANPRYHGVIEAFAKLTGVPVLLNTSFNRQEPIVEHPREAVSCYLATGLDVLVMGDYYTSDRSTAAAVDRDASEYAG
ncbi:MAG: carbamoyltransferase [Hyphomicrobiaceae bacterium]|nr:carbamoyltransferase [Hyphomicrobiaceae bacterium]